MTNILLLSNLSLSFHYLNSLVKKHLIVAMSR